jgi:hypothetical protein
LFVARMRRAVLSQCFLAPAELLIHLPQVGVSLGSPLGRGSPDCAPVVNLEIGGADESQRGKDAHQGCGDRDDNDTETRLTTRGQSRPTASETYLRKESLL